jgi:AraC family transcriptional regulator
MNPTTIEVYRERILRVLLHIQQHLDEALCLEDLAALAHFSPYHFHRVFRGMVGETLMEYVRRLRLERAAHRLTHGDWPVTRIAFEAGYETHEAFTRAFRAMFADSPSAYRQARRAIVYPSVPSGIHYVPGCDLDTFTPTGETVMEVKIQQVKPMRVAFVRHVGPYAQCGVAWEKLCGWAGQHGLLGPNTIVVGVCYDDPDVTPSDRVRYDACITVNADVTPAGEVGVQDIGGGDYAITVHRGPYEKLSETYAQLCGQWLPSSGRELRSSPSLEIYHNDPATTRPEDLVTDIYVPV